MVGLSEVLDVIEGPGTGYTDDKRQVPVKGRHCRGLVRFLHERSPSNAKKSVIKPLFAGSNESQPQAYNGLLG